MEDFLHSAVNALLFGLAWASAWGILLTLLLGTSPQRLSDDTTEAKEPKESELPAGEVTIDGEAVWL